MLEKFVMYECLSQEFTLIINTYYVLVKSKSQESLGCVNQVGKLTNKNTKIITEVSPF